MTIRSRTGRGLCAGGALAIALAAPAWTRPRLQPGAPAVALSPNIPGEVTFGSDTSLPGLQRDFDIFSWNSFIALNWPRAANGNADPAKKPGAAGDNPTVWEAWQDSSDIFLPGGAAPVWGVRGDVPAVCRVPGAANLRVLAQLGKTPGLLEESVQPFDTGPLIDQAGRYARFQILTNRVMFDYILDNRLYSKAGQQAFAGTVAFPCGTPTAQGAIMVKAAWKIMAPGEASRFHTSRVLVYTPATASPRRAASCTAATVGLVGFHIGHRTTSASQWVWSTFEHEDNAPTEPQVKSGPVKARYNFYNPKCATCPVNTAPPRPWIPTRPGPPTQVVRIDMLPPFATDSAAAVNAGAKRLLAGVSASSVWRRYELISTQWPTHTGRCAAIPTDPAGTPAPTLLANTTLETYIQGTTRNVSSSCILCHANAAMTTGRASDFTYLLQRAQ